MALILLIVYIVIFILQIVLLVISIRRKKKKLWLSLFLAEFIPMLIANRVAVYYDNLPGYDIIPGFSYIREVLFSYGAAIVYGLFFLVSVCSGIVSTKK